MVLEAVDRAIDQNVKRWKYISGILSNWQKSHVKTMADVMQLDETYKNQKVVENMQHVGDAMAEIIKRAEAMRKKLQAENETCQVTSNAYKCATCQDTEVLFYEEVNEFGMRVSVQKDCSCKVQRVIERRLQNAMIPEEFAQARFDSYQQETEKQKLLYGTIVKYLRNFEEIKGTKQNSLGFIATFGELRIKQLEPSKRAQAKREHNSFGLGKTHLQVAAAKYLMKQGYSVLLISDGTFMDDLIAER